MPKRGPKSGVKAGSALAEAIVPRAVGPAEDVWIQDDLFAAPVQSARHRAEAQAPGEKRGPGRPKGSANTRSKAWCDYLLTRYTSPLESLVAVASMRPAELLQELGIAPDGEIDGRPLYPVDLVKWAFEQVKDATKAALPHLHERRGAMVTDDDGNEVPVFAVGALIRPAGSARIEAGSGDILDMRPADVRTEGNQQVSDADDGKSTAGKSTPDANPLNENGKS